MTADWPLLSTVIWLPIIGGFLVIASGDRTPDVSRWLALGVAVLTFLFSIPLYSGFDTASDACSSWKTGRGSPPST